MAGEHSGRAHALCSASSASRWLACPGSVGLSFGLPSEPPSPYAAEGTRAHELGDKILNRWLADGRKLDAAWVDALRPDYADTEEDGWSMVDYVMTYVNTVIEKLEGFEKVNVKIEHRLTLCEEKKMFGTVDLVAIGTRGGAPVGLVKDFKYGKGVAVSAENNPQLAYYACALRKSSKQDLHAVETVIVQPRVDEWLTEAELKKDKLDEWSGVLHRGAERALLQVLTKKYELNPGEHCRFCPALKVCGAHQRYLAERAGLDFAEEKPLPPAVPELSVEKIGRILSVREELSRFIDAVETRAKELIAAGTPVPGWKLVEGRTQRRWGFPEEKTAAELTARGIVEPFERKLKPFSAVEKELGKGKIDDLLIKPAGAPTLAREDDPRPGISAPGAEFVTEG